MIGDGYVEDCTGNSIRPLAIANATLETKEKIAWEVYMGGMVPVSTGIDIIERTFTKTTSIENATQREYIGF